MDSVLIPFFGSKRPDKALEEAIGRVKENGKLYLFHIADDALTRSIRYNTGQLGDDNELVGTFRKSQRKLHEKTAKRYEEEVKKAVTDRNISVELLSVEGDPAIEVLKAIKEYEIDLVVVEGLRERVAEIFHGDEIKFLKDKAPCDVLTVS